MLSLHQLLFSNTSEYNCCLCEVATVWYS